MVHSKKLTIEADVKKGDMLHTLNFSFKGKPQDRLRMIPSLRLAMSPMKVPCIVLFDNVLSVILTKDIGTSDDHVTFIDEIATLIGDELGYKAEDVAVQHSAELTQFICDLSNAEQEALPLDLIQVPNWDEDGPPARHLRAL